MDKGANFLAMRGRRRGRIAAAVVVTILAYAWFDGGEEQQHPIEEPVAMPETSP